MDDNRRGRRDVLVVNGDTKKHYMPLLKTPLTIAARSC